jgi:hypothetical protein
VLDARRERDVIRYLVTQKQATPLYRNGEVVVLELDRAAT